MFSALVDDFITQYPFIQTPEARNIFGMVMPHLREANYSSIANAWEVYRYCAAVRELTQGESLPEVQREYGYHSWSPEERGEYDAMYDR